MQGTLTAFKAHRDSADNRGIAFRMTFAEWWAVWEPHWQRRHLDALCMCRKGDVGDYVTGNVYIATRSQNATDWHVNLAAAKANRVTANAPVLHAPPTIAESSVTASIREQFAHAELDVFMKALRDTGGNVSAAARRLGITFRAARYILAKHGMTKTDALARLLT